MPCRAFAPCEERDHIRPGMGGGATPSTASRRALLVQCGTDLKRDGAHQVLPRAAGARYHRSPLTIAIAPLAAAGRATSMVATDCLGSQWKASTTTTRCAG